MVAVAYLALTSWESLSEQEQLSTKDTFWLPVKQAKHLAYDHDTILSTALARLRSRAAYTTLMSKLMPKEFTLTELEHAYEVVVKKDLDKRNFRKKILKLSIVTPVARKKSVGAFRPAQLYRFASSKIDEIEVL